MAIEKNNPRHSGSKKSGYKPIVPAVQQAMQLLAYLAETSGNQLTLTEICERLNIPKSKGYTLLNTLKQFDFVEKEEHTKTYRLGLGIVYLARHVLNAFDIRDIVNPYLSSLAEDTISTAHFGLVRQNRLYIVAKRETSQAFGYTLREGNYYDITHGSHGKAIVAFMSETEQKEILARDWLCFYGDGEPFDMDQLKQELKRCRRLGYAQDPGETNPGIKGISAPVFGEKEKIIGSVVLIGTFPKSDIKTYGPKVVDTAKQISQKLGAEVDGLLP